MFRELTSHAVDGLPGALRVEVQGEPGPGNANHSYLIHTNGIFSFDKDAVALEFQKGSVREGGVNGITNESLLAIIEDRLIGFQSGAFACSENDQALLKVQQALSFLHDRRRPSGVTDD